MLVDELRPCKQPHNGVGSLSRPNGLTESSEGHVGRLQHVGSLPTPQLAGLPQQLAKGDCHGRSQAGVRALACLLAAGI